MNQPHQPTAEQLRQARHSGCKTALSHLPAQRQSDLLAVHAGLDARREKNITEFTNKVRAK